MEDYTSRGIRHEKSRRRCEKCVTLKNKYLIEKRVNVELGNRIGVGNSRTAGLSLFISIGMETTVQRGI